MGSPMPDVFLSYARADESQARRLAEALESRGWSVFWDRRILDGEDFSVTIQHALDDARCIVVLWSRTSVASRFVRDEATEGINGRLVPALIEAVKQPLGFRQIQAADLSDWQGLPTHEEFQRLVRSIAAIVPPSSAATAIESPPAVPAAGPDSPPPPTSIADAPEGIEHVEAFLEQPLVVDSIEQDWERRARSKPRARATPQGVPGPRFSRYFHKRSRVPVVLAAPLLAAGAVAFMWADISSTDPPAPPQRPPLRVGPGPPQHTLPELSDPPGQPAPNPAVERLRRTTPRSTNVIPGLPPNTARPSSPIQPDVPSGRPSPEKPPPSVDTRGADHQAVEATLLQFVAAYENRDPEALRRIWPSMASSTAATLREATSYQVELRDKTISIDGDRATVTCRRWIVHQPGSGIRRSIQPLTTITLRKEAVGWVITGVR